MTRRVAVRNAGYPFASRRRHAANSSDR